MFGDRDRMDARGVREHHIARDHLGEQRGAHPGGGRVHPPKTPGRDEQRARDPEPEIDLRIADGIDALQRNRFTITSQSDRMGYRLAGRERIARASDREMISDATFIGAVQIPSSGDPILLMADRQTTGGYPQIATVITADLPLAGQLAPGDWVEFQLCTHAEAIAALVAQEAALLAFA